MLYNAKMNALRLLKEQDAFNAYRIVSDYAPHKEESIAASVFYISRGVEEYGGEAALTYATQFDLYLHSIDKASRLADVIIETFADKRFLAHAYNARGRVEEENVGHIYFDDAPLDLSGFYDDRGIYRMVVRLSTRYVLAY